MITTFVSLSMLGVALLWSLKIIYTDQRFSADDPLILTTSIAAWLLIFLGLAALLSPIGMFIALGISGMVVAKYRESERRALLWSLAVAAERGLPLAPAARAFAARRSDEMGRRALLLANSLDGGVPLPDALRRSGNPLPTDAWLAVRLGTDMNSLGSSLREAARSGGRYAEIWKPVFEGSMYLMAIALVGLNVIMFVMIKIVPTFQAIMEDFAVTPPPLTVFTIQAAQFFAQRWFLMAPVLLYLGGVLFVSAVHYVRGTVWQPPLFGKLFGQLDGPYLLNALALCVERQLPMDQALDRVAGFYPRASVAGRIKQAAREVRNGTDWCESLQDHQLLRVADAAVLHSATRVGNLSWALREMAESSARRITYRAQAFLNLAMPLVLVLLAVPVALLAVACFQPLIQIINSVAGI